MNKIEHLPNTGFYTYYPDGPIEKSLSLYQECGNSITLYFRDGISQQVQVPPAYPLEPYQAQFGITVSLPFRALFVQSWERGLCCLNIDSSEILWKFPKKHAYEVYAIGEFVYAHFMDDGLRKLDIRTGQCIKRFPYTTGGVCFMLPECGFFIGPVRGRYQILDFEFCKRYAIPKDVLNSNRRETFLIRGAELTDGQLSVCGREDSGGETMDADCDTVKFERQVSLKDFAG